MCGLINKRDIGFYAPANDKQQLYISLCQRNLELSTPLWLIPSVTKIESVKKICNDREDLMTRVWIHMWLHHLQTGQTLYQCSQILSPKRYRFCGRCSEYLLEITKCIGNYSLCSGCIRTLCLQ